MFRRWRGRSSGEKGGETVADLSGRIHDRKLDEIVHRRKTPRLGRALRQQNEEGTFAYHDALQRQRGESIAADGSPVRLGVVDRETGRIVEPFIREDEDTEPDPSATPPPPPPTSAA